MLQPWLCVCTLVCVCCVQSSVCFSNGSVSYSCGHMIPGHGSISPSSLSPPYTLSASSATYRPGQNITVTLEVSGGSPPTDFQGFLLQARSSDRNVLLWPIGRFINIDPAHFTALHCNNRLNSAVSQSTGIQKTKVQLTWEAPNNSSYGDIYFSVSVVQSYPTFWVKVNSSSLSPTSSAARCSSSLLLMVALLSAFAVHRTIQISGVIVTLSSGAKHGEV